MSPVTSLTARALLAGASLLAIVTITGCGPARTAPQPVPPVSDRYAIVPMPKHLVERTGDFRLDAGTRIVLGDTSAALRTVTELFAAPLRAASGLPLPVSTSAASAAPANAIVIALDRGAAVSGPESYRLTVTPEGATLRAPTPAGLLYGLETLRQLLPAAVERDVRALGNWGPDSRPAATLAAASAARWTIPAVEIEDAPRFQYRGILLDVARHYFAPDFLRELVDVMALYKFNRLHLHFTDDQGWRLEIRKYPKLTTVGAWRKETILGQHFDPYVGDGKPHGGFYTQQQIRDLVAYAAARNVTIVPEIEMPGHAGAAIAAYPELACTPGPFQVSTVWGVHEEIFCPSEKTFAFLEDVLTEVMDLFPGEYIHIGGDEVPKVRWQASPIAQDIIRREGLKNEEELQSWFTRRIERFLREHGRKLIGWDEILEGGIAPQATVMSWRGMDGGIAAARQGHDVVMSPGDYAYLDHYQADPKNEPLAIGGFLPLDTVYAFEPVPPVLTPTEATHILGAQGNLWTEYIATPDYAEYMLFPRALALSEVSWSPKESHDWKGFLARLRAQFGRLDILGVDYHVPEPIGPWGERRVLEDRAQVTMATSVPGGTVRYTTDGSEPTASSPVYTAPITVSVATPVTVSARVFLPNGRLSGIAVAHFARATWKPAVAVDAASLRPGLAYAYGEGPFTTVDSVRGMKVARTGTVSEIGLRGDERPEQYAVRLSGYLKVPNDALYMLYLASDDGGRIIVDDDVVIDHDGQHDATEKQAQVALRAGYHRLEVLYFQGPGGAALRASVEAQGLEKQNVPKEWLLHTDGTAR